MRWRQRMDGEPLATEAERIRDQLRRVILGEAWHGPSVSEAWVRFDEESAWVRVPSSGHHACEILLHIVAWLEIVRARLEGRVVSPTPQQDWPPAPAPGAESWKAAMDRLRSAHAQLDAALAELPDERLGEVTAGKDYTIHFMLQGVIQHCAYHAGQLMMMSRAVGATRPEP